MPRIPANLQDTFNEFCRARNLKPDAVLTEALAEYLVKREVLPASWLKDQHQLKVREKGI